MRLTSRLVGLLWLSAAANPVAGWTEEVAVPVARALDFIEALQLYREGVDYRFQDRILSPLTEEDRLAFSGLDFYEARPELAIKAVLQPATDRSTFAMPTFNGRTLAFSHYVTIDANVHGRQISLKAFRRESEESLQRILLIPFKDTTNEAETYPGGRYIVIDFPMPEPFVLDFNRAANPLCAYDPNYACPIPPPENRLDFPIEAGEKRFH